MALSVPLSRLTSRVGGGSAFYVRPLHAMNTAVEFHDSTVSDISARGDVVTVHFRPAFLHKSERRPGFDAGTGWVQEARLVFTEAATIGTYPDLPCSLMDGELTVGDVLYLNLLTVPFDTLARTELRMVFDLAHTVIITGQGARFELIGEPRYVEEFRPHTPAV